MKEIITRGCYRWGLEPTPEALSRMERFGHLLIERNRVMNLTAVTEPEEIARRHFLDCLFLLTITDFGGKRIIDVGSGAGFPAVPLLCYDPELDITALDATAKRVDFIRESCAQLGLPVTPLCARAEEVGHSPSHRGAYHIAVSRAVAPLQALAEICLPLLGPGGLFLPLKSQNPESEAEIAAARPAIERLGGKLEALVPYDVPGLSAKHQVLVIEKLGDTPAQYPRRWAKIKAEPLV